MHNDITLKICSAGLQFSIVLYCYLERAVQVTRTRAAKTIKEQRDLPSLEVRNLLALLPSPSSTNTLPAPEVQYLDQNYFKRPSVI